MLRAVSLRWCWSSKQELSISASKESPTLLNRYWRHLSWSSRFNLSSCINPPPRDVLLECQRWKKQLLLLRFHTLLCHILQKESGWARAPPVFLCVSHGPPWLKPENTHPRQKWTVHPASNNNSGRQPFFRHGFFLLFKVKQCFLLTN